ncbi:hypothetical protein MTR67_003615 [Solanum verrucosum]|uniref:DUF3444 domain-containing protein n=1 Tax=Solanum verrucosum TaxID=315347 RepID=A0AAF0PVZ7_SOLVR|nr:hypothetical protein MTR67_003615 [Solanum verrucosum]
MMGNRKKTSIKSTENCVVSAYLLRQNFLCLNEENQPRYTWHRHRVNYLSDEEEDASKRFKGVGYPSPTKESSEVKHLSSEESLQNTKMELRLQNEVGQVWAAYDTLDVMPRFYAIIRNILSPAFKLCIRAYRLGTSEDIEDLPMFSHLACSMNGNNCDAIKIFPLEGETWPLSKDWDMSCCPHLGSNKNFNYEFIEVLSNYVDSIGLHVAYLVKAKGFTCLFRRAGDPFLIPAKDMFRFSHRIPSMKMIGMVRDNVPEGSFELDPSSLPTDQVDISASSIDQREPSNFMDSVNSAEN